MALKTVFLFLIIITLLKCESCGAYTEPCHYHMSVNISDGEHFLNGSIFHKNVFYPPSQQFNYTDETGANQTRGCLCNIKPCIRKCCDEGSAILQGKCAQTNHSSINPFDPVIYSGKQPLDGMSSAKHFGLVFGNPCTEDRFLLDPYTTPPTPDDEFFLQSNGFLYVPNSSGFNHSQMNYCLEAWIQDPYADDDNNDWTVKILPLVCFGTEPVMAPLNYSMYIFFAGGMIISTLFLLATFVVYAFIPELQNIHGKSLMCYVLGLIVAYVSLSTIQIKSSQHNVIPTSECFSFAFTIYLSFMVSFFWLNTMCFDLWWTFRGLRVVPGGKKAAERKRFLYYCIYAFGGPIALTGICAAMQFHSNLPEGIVKPNFGVSGCWFHTWLSGFIYFYVPIIILVVCNLSLFASTTYTIQQIKKDTAILVAGDNSAQSRYVKNEQRFHLYLKLFLVMGINWTVECISFSIGGSFILWIVTDIGNLFLGIVIFFVFVWNIKVRTLVKERFNELRYGKSSRVVSHTTYNRSSNDTRTTSTDRSHEYSVRLSNINRNQRTSGQMSS